MLELLDGRQVSAVYLPSGKDEPEPQREAHSVSSLSSFFEKRFYLYPLSIIYNDSYNILEYTWYILILYFWWPSGFWGHLGVVVSFVVTSCCRGFLLGPCRAFGSATWRQGNNDDRDSTVVGRISVKVGSWHLLLMNIWYDLISLVEVCWSHKLFFTDLGCLRNQYLRKPNMALKEMMR